jgi:hypothetical protein
MPRLSPPATRCGPAALRARRRLPSCARSGPRQPRAARRAQGLAGLAAQRHRLRGLALRLRARVRASPPAQAKGALGGSDRGTELGAALCHSVTPCPPPACLLRGVRVWAQLRCAVHPGVRGHHVGRGAAQRGRVLGGPALERPAAGRQAGRGPSAAVRLGTGHRRALRGAWVCRAGSARTPGRTRAGGCVAHDGRMLWGRTEADETYAGQALAFTGPAPSTSPPRASCRRPSSGGSSTGCVTHRCLAHLTAVPTW